MSGIQNTEYRLQNTEVGSLRCQRSDIRLPTSEVLIIQPDEYREKH